MGLAIGRNDIFWRRINSNNDSILLVFIQSSCPPTVTASKINQGTFDILQSLSQTLLISRCSSNSVKERKLRGSFQLGVCIDFIDALVFIVGDDKSAALFVVKDRGLMVDYVPQCWLLPLLHSAYMTLSREL